MNFGKFDEETLFHIEDSKIYKDLGSGIKTVEFILKYSENSILFLEAKKSCPNAANRYESEEKEQKFEEYYSSSVEIYISCEKCKGYYMACWTVGRIKSQITASTKNMGH